MACPQVLQFPEKQWGTGSSPEIIEQRKQELGAWINALLSSDGSADLITGDPIIERELMAFLSPDDTCPVVTPALYAELGVPAPHTLARNGSSPAAAGWVPSGEWTPTAQQCSVHMEQHTTNACAAAAAAVCSGGDTAETALTRHLAEHARSLGFVHSGGSPATPPVAAPAAAGGFTDPEMERLRSQLETERLKRQELEAEVAQLREIWKVG